MNDETPAQKAEQKTKPWSDYPIGTKAPAFNGGHWTRVELGWKWGALDGGGGTFPTPGGDSNRTVILPNETPNPAKNSTPEGQLSLNQILDEIAARANAATPGHWAKDWGRVRGEQCETICCVADQLDWDQEPWIADSTFIAAARSDVPTLVKALRRAVQCMHILTAAHPAAIYHYENEIAQLLREPEKKQG